MSSVGSVWCILANVCYTLINSSWILSDYYSAWHGGDLQWVFLEGTVEYSWPSTHGMCKCIAIILYFFFLVLCLERSRPAVVKFSMYENHLEGSLQDRLQSPWRIRLSDSRGIEYVWEVVFLTCKGDAVQLVCLRAMQPIKWWKSVYTLKGKEALNSANLKKCDLDLMGYCLLLRFPL